MKRSAQSLLIGIFVLFLAMVVFSAVPAFAATITVTSLADSGPGSLRDSIASAAPGDTINFGVTGTITLTSGELLIGKNLTISGPGASSVAISANNLSRVFEIGSAFTVAISGLTIQNGKTDTGGGIYNGGTLMLSNSTLSSNSATSEGGGIANYGTLTVTNSTLSGNSSVAAGGGFLNFGGTLTLTNSTLSGNSVTGGGFVTGGGIFIYGGTVTVTNSTLSGNSAWAGGGIYTLYATVMLANNTIFGNSAPYGGGGIFVYNGTATAKNTILANGPSGGNCYQPLTSRGHNLSDDSSCSSYFNQTGDLNSTAAGLDPNGLRNNGGPTQTIALLSTSTAVNAIPVIPTNYCTDVNGAPVTTDQRGFTRPQGLACDIGAFQLASDDDSALAQLNGSNTFTGNQTVNGTANATNFVGNGAGLTGVTAANSLALGGIPAGNYARLDVGNLFSGNQGVNGNVTASAFVGDGSALTNIIAATANTANFALSAGDAMTLGHVAAGNYARLDIGNAFNGNQTITSGNLALDNTNASGTTGVITLGGNPFVHNYGTSNTFLGQGVGNFSITGNENTASGSRAFYSNTAGSDNVAIGVDALHFNSTGSFNSASGAGALRSNNAGSNNTAFGHNALYNIPGGNGNIALGDSAGANASGDVNIYIGNVGAPESGVIRIGNSSSQTKAFIAGITGVTTGLAGTPVVVDANGQLGTATGGSVGTITGVTAGTGLSGGGTTGNVSLSIPAAGVNNAMLANPSLSVNAGAGLTGGGSVALGGTTTVSLTPNTCAVGSAVTAHPFTCTAFPTFGANTFTGNQTMPNLSVTGVISNGGGINSTSGNFSSGLFGNNGSGVGVGGQSNSSYGVIGQSNSSAGVYGANFTAASNTAAAVFENTAQTNTGNILLGQYNGFSEFKVDAKGDVTANGNVTAGGSVTIGTGGTPIVEHLSKTFNNVPVPGLGPNNCATLAALTFNGASDGDSIALGVPNALVAGTNFGGAILEYFGWVSAANTVAIRVCNPHGGSANPAVSGTIRVDIWKH